MKEYTKRLILLIFILSLTLFFLVVSVKLHNKRVNDKLLVSSVSDYLTEINYDEIATYVVEQPNTIIYISNSSESSSKEFEQLFIPLIIKYNLENYVTYININSNNIIDPFYQQAPQLIFYKDSAVNDIVSCNQFKNKDDIKKIFKERGFIGD